MNREQFRQTLAAALCNLPEEEIRKSLDFYDEMIDDRMEDGMSEEEAVASLEPAEQIAERIIGETPLPTLVMQSVKGRSMSALSIILLIMGSPIWLSIAIALFAVVLSVIISLWAVVISLAACVLALALTAPIVFAVGIVALFSSSGLLGMGFCLSAALLCAGLAILFALAVKYSAIGIVKLMKLCGKGIKAMFVHKEGK